MKKKNVVVRVENLDEFRSEFPLEYQKISHLLEQISTIIQNTGFDVKLSLSNSFSFIVNNKDYASKLNNNQTITIKVTDLNKTAPSNEINFAKFLKSPKKHFHVLTSRETKDLVHAVKRVQDDPPLL